MQYQLNVYGQEDTAFCLMTILSNLAELLNRMRAAITTKYPRAKLASDPTGYSVSAGPGQNVVTCTPLPRHSCDTASPNPITNALDAAYTAMRGRG